MNVDKNIILTYMLYNGYDISLKSEDFGISFANNIWYGVPVLQLNYNPNKVSLDRVKAECNIWYCHPLNGKFDEWSFRLIDYKIMKTDYVIMLSVVRDLKIKNILDDEFSK